MTRIEFCHGHRAAGDPLANVAAGLPACGSPARDDGHYYAMQLGRPSVRGLAGAGGGPPRAVDLPYSEQLWILNTTTAEGKPSNVLRAASLVYPPLGSKCGSICTE